MLSYYFVILRWIKFIDICFSVWSQTILPISTHSLVNSSKSKKNAKIIPNWSWVHKFDLPNSAFYQINHKTKYFQQCIMHLLHPANLATFSYNKNKHNVMPRRIHVIHNLMQKAKVNRKLLHEQHQCCKNNKWKIIMQLQCWLIHHVVLINCKSNNFISTHN